MEIGAGEVEGARPSTNFGPSIPNLDLIFAFLTPKLSRCFSVFLDLQYHWSIFTAIYENEAEALLESDDSLHSLPVNLGDVQPCIYTLHCVVRDVLP